MPKKGGRRVFLIFSVIKNDFYIFFLSFIIRENIELIKKLEKMIVCLEMHLNVNQYFKKFNFKIN